MNECAGTLPFVEAEHKMSVIIVRLLKLSVTVACECDGAVDRLPPEPAVGGLPEDDQRCVQEVLQAESWPCLLPLCAVHG